MAKNAGFENLSKRDDSDELTKTLGIGPTVTGREAIPAPPKKEQCDFDSKPDDVDTTGNLTGKRLYMMRHVERLDRIYPEWARLAFASGRYQQVDLNMPVNVPKRQVKDYKNDSPITEIGYITGQMVGRACNLNRLGLTHIYTSPALRCIQSAHAVSRGFGGIPIRVEPGLFECQGFLKQCPAFMSLDDLCAPPMNYSLDRDYVPQMPVKDLKDWNTEKAGPFQDRVIAVTQKILETHGGTPFFVIHADVIDAIHRGLRGKPRHNMSKGEMEKIGAKYPYGSVVALEQMDSGLWRSVQSAVPTMNYTGYTNCVDFKFYNRN